MSGKYSSESINLSIFFSAQEDPGAVKEVA